MLYGRVLSKLSHRLVFALNDGFHRSCTYHQRLLIHKPASEIPIKTMQQVIDAIKEKTDYQKMLIQKIDLSQLSEILPKSQDQLPPRRMHDSYECAFIPLSTNEILREKYATSFGGVRVGRVLEDLDIIGGWCAYKHLLNPLQRDDMPYPYLLVTATVDRMDFTEGINLVNDKDIKVEGFVSWTGWSSLETTLDVSQLVGDEWKKIMRAVFVFAMRDPTTGGAAVINPLICETEEEKQIFQKGQHQKFVRKMFEKESLFNSPPTDKEKSLIHQLFIGMASPEQYSYSPKNKPQNSVWMVETQLKNLIICHPEFRNVFHKMFGGFLMRQALELAYANAYVYSKRQPEIRYIDDIIFRCPVDIGSLLYLNSQVVYTEENYIQISTKASVVDPATDSSDLTNIFHFTFAVKSSVPQVIPHSYDEALRYIDGRRRYQLVRGISKFYDPR